MNLQDEELIKSEFLSAISDACDRLRDRTAVVQSPVKLPEHLPPFDPKLFDGFEQDEQLLSPIIFRLDIDD